MTSPPKSPKLATLGRLGLTLTSARTRPWRVMVLGHSAVGKSAFVVRFLTRKFIGDYDPNLERVCSTTAFIDGDSLQLEILDSTGNHMQSGITTVFEEKLRWADAFVLIYSATDKCSFDECSRLRFLISYNKRRRRHLFGTSHGVHHESAATHVPIVLVANKVDQEEDRMVTFLEGSKRSRDLNCDSFHEISVREHVEAPRTIIEQLYLHWKRLHHNSHIGRDNGSFSAPKTRLSPSDTSPLSVIFGRKSHVSCVHRQTSKSSSMDIINEREDHPTRPDVFHFGSPPPDPVQVPEQFRSRASTEGSLNYRAKRVEVQVSSTSSTPTYPPGFRASRRMSISLRGQN